MGQRLLVHGHHRHLLGPYADAPGPVGAMVAPTVVGAFAHDLVPWRREWAERFSDVRRWAPHGAGGHFAAWERPGALVGDLRAAVAAGSAT